MDMNEFLTSIFTFLMVVIIAWFTYTIINIYVTIFRCRKLDHSLKPCLNSKGKFFFSAMTILYIICFIGGLGVCIFGLLCNKSTLFNGGLNVAAFMSVLYAYIISSIVLIGRKNMMVGRMQIDYRKLKKVNFTYNNKMSFVYAQKDYSFSTRFVDITQLRKVISK